MADIEGIVVELTTGSQSWAGTNDQLFLGVVGTRGGREFNLDVSGFNDFEPNTKVNYVIGKEFALALSGPEKKPITAPASLTQGSKMDQPSITHVYLRKQGQMSQNADDAWRLQEARVWLMNASDPTRIWESRGPLTLSIEDGLQIWLSSDWK
ncbi:MAG: hypothetical protein J0L84_04560 [Verrucomicrobia bacterium]|nr:hypothetical protein [Verrucomicrobiota bacterium]